MGRYRTLFRRNSVALIKKLIGEGKTIKKVLKMIGCSAKMIANALNMATRYERIEPGEKPFL
ncbi:unnamed protein product [Staurois parvus]|uniref:Transposase n=1 Tax=Staurois parvus TaxID=386267 RepID=A0ABN9G608_9NEOB|nr:unnamed protein product [Staurois parvus]